MQCSEAGIVRQKGKISNQIKNINWRFSCTKGLCTIQMAFVALKALKWALKGQELASDTLEILLANAYHWNPCWKVDEMSHFWLFALYFHKNTTFFYLYFAMISAAFQFHFNIFDFGVASARRWRFSTNHRALVSKVAIFGQSQSSRQ